MAKSLIRGEFFGKQVLQCSLGAIAILFLTNACSPTVKVEAPDKPIVINLNVKIEQEVRIRVERDIENLLSENPDIF